MEELNVELDDETAGWLEAAAAEASSHFPSSSRNCFERRETRRQRQNLGTDQPAAPSPRPIA